MTQYRFILCDVFTRNRFGGNQLAVLPDATGLSDVQMQQIAREFNFSETTFVFPGGPGFTRQVRIFTPTTEVPFAGHPNIGTAFALAATGELGAIETDQTLVFDEAAGAVTITISAREGSFWCELRAPQALTLGPSITPERAAAALSLDVSAVVIANHKPRVASVGLPFVVVELKDRLALEQARADHGVFAAIRETGIVPDLHLYTRSTGEFAIRARMFAPFDGVPEDPATGSANCALAALLAHQAPAERRDFAWRIAQGVEMGRPSVLDARARRNDDGTVTVWIGGNSVLVGEGAIHVD